MFTQKRRTHRNANRLLVLTHNLAKLIQATKYGEFPVCGSGKSGKVHRVIAVSDALYDRFQETDFYHFLFMFLRENSRGAAFRDALSDEQRCRDIWARLYDPALEKMDLSLRHAFMLGSDVAGEPLDGDIPEEMTPMHMKAKLDIWNFVPFSTFDRRAD